MSANTKNCLVGSTDEENKKRHDYSASTVDGPKQEQPDTQNTPRLGYAAGQCPVDDGVFETFRSQIAPMPSGFEISKFGVFHKPESAAPNTPKTYISGPVGVAAYVETDAGRSGIDVVFIDKHGHIKSTIVWAALLRHPKKLLDELSDSGLHQDTNIPSTRHPLGHLLNSSTPEKTKGFLERHGWSEKLDAFVLGQFIIGRADAILDTTMSKPRVRLLGSVADWQTNVAQLACGNDLAISAMCHALAGPTWRLLGLTGHTIHFYGELGSGKTALTQIANSVYGNPADLISSWNITPTAAEIKLSSHNDTLIVLANLNREDKQGAAKIGQMVKNGKAKTRCRSNGTIPPENSWVLSGISYGRRSFQKEADPREYRAMATSEERITSVPAFNGSAERTAFPNLHGFSSKLDFYKAIEQATETNHGSIGQNWIAKLVDDPVGVSGIIRRHRDELLKIWSSHHGIEENPSVFLAFATIAATGSTCAELDLLPFEKDDIWAAVLATYDRSRADQIKGIQETYVPFLARLHDVLVDRTHRNVDVVFDGDDAFVRSTVIKNLLKQASRISPGIPAANLARAYRELDTIQIIKKNVDGETSFKVRFDGKQRRAIKIRISSLHDVIRPQPKTRLTFGRNVTSVSEEKISENHPDTKLDCSDQNGANLMSEIAQ